MAETDPVYQSEIEVKFEEEGGEEQHKQIISLVKTIPSFSQVADTDVSISKLHGGLTNKLYKVKIKEKETVLVRIYGIGSDLMIDRKHENELLKALSSVGLSAHLYLEFKNGIVYSFVPGSILLPAEYYDKNIYQLVAAHLAKWHTTSVEAPSPPSSEESLTSSVQLFEEIYSKEAEEKEAKAEYSSKNIHQHAFVSHPGNLWTNLESWYALAKKLPNKSGAVIEWDTLKEQIGKIRKESEKMSITSDIVMCHNDLLLGNVIYDSEKNKISFIDYEYAAYNPRGFDIANHFAELGMDYDELTMNPKLPEYEFRLKFIEEYLSHFNQFTKDGKGKGEITKREFLERAEKEIRYWICLAHLRWIFWSLIQEHHSVIEFDYGKFTRIRLDAYHFLYQQLLFDL